MSASDPSPRAKKLSFNIRVFVSNYLQEHLLTLPSLPTQAQLKEIIERKEKEAEEKLREIELQREVQRQRKAIKEAEEKSSKLSLSSKFSKVDKMINSKLKGLQNAVNFTAGSEVVTVTGEKEEGGWMCKTDMVVRSVDCEEDPFVIQREQLLSYIAQAQEANRLDEVRSLELSLKDIEKAMEEQKMSYGF